jgi:hypothetical protein
MKSKREQAVTDMWRDVEVIVGNWTVDDRSREQETLQRLLLEIAYNPSVPLSVVSDIGMAIRIAYDLGRIKRASVN